MSKMLQGHSRPVAQGVASSAVWEFFVRGIPTLVTWYFAHQAAIRGWAWPLVILFGIIAFLAVSVAVDLLRRKYPQTETNSEDSDLTTRLADVERELGTAKVKFEGKRKDFEKAQQISRELQGQIKQTQDDLDIARTQLAEINWLKERADEQRKSLFRWLPVEKFQIIRSELDRQKPNIDFVICVHNKSIFDVAFGAITGELLYANIPSTGTFQWLGDAPSLRSGEDYITGELRFTYADADDVKELRRTDSGFEMRTKLNLNLAPTNETIAIRFAPRVDGFLVMREKYPQIPSA